VGFIFSLFVTLLLFVIFLGFFYSCRGEGGMGFLFL
jgi:hypothetical protein